MDGDVVDRAQLRNPTDGLFLGELLFQVFDVDEDSTCVLDVRSGYPSLGQRIGEPAPRRGQRRRQGRRARVAGLVAQQFACRAEAFGGSLEEMRRSRPAHRHPAPSTFLVHAADSFL
ncbi:hypothetical protein [Rhodococcus sp. CX]|uniref:hypothetical protein n=1 Tax=Rhodococcus sp. CX TaxID=2789880 RepID=UPI001E62D4ED|nr:hypothetical protein [Rhodococcus sp. CX]